MNKKAEGKKTGKKGNQDRNQGKDKKLDEEQSDLSSEEPPPQSDGNLLLCYRIITITFHRWSQISL